MSDLIGIIEPNTLNIVGVIESKEINIIGEIIGAGPAGHTYDDTIITSSLADMPTQVTLFGCKGDGVTDDSIKFKLALDTANGRDIRVPDGIYVLDGIELPNKVSLILDNDAVLLAKPNSPIGYMFTTNITTSTVAFKMRGGTVDGNKTNQSGRPSIIIGFCPTDSYIDIQHVTFKDTIKNCLNINGFGGVIDLSHNKFIGQAEATGIDSQATSIMSVMSGEVNANGLIRFNHNTCIGTATPLVEGGSPGGIFLCNRDNEGDITHGNVSTLEAIGNYFYGYGLNCAINDISPIHCYPSWGGARVVGNYFEQCGFCAISGKSVQNFVCSNNVIVNGQWSSKNIAQEGAISYVPGYMAGTSLRPRATITGNVIDSPGGQPGIAKQYGIAVHGIPGSFATDVVVSDNVISGAGVCIGVDYVTNLTISNNILDGADGGLDGVEYGIRLDNINGDIIINGNRIISKNGKGIATGINISDARLFVSNNYFKNTYASGFCVLARGVNFAKFTGNSFEAIAGVVADLRTNGTNNVGHLNWDENNIILAGATSFGWSTIDKVTGTVRGTSSPLNVITPGEIGTKYIQTDGTTSFLWQSKGITSASWVAISTGVVSGTGAYIEGKTITTNAQTDGVNNTFGHASNQIADDISTSTILGGGSTGYNNIIGGDGILTVNTITPNAVAVGTVAHVSVVAGYDNVAGSLSSKIISDHSYTEVGGSGHNAIYGGANNVIKSTANFAGIFAGYHCEVSGASGFATGGDQIVSAVSGFASGNHQTVSGTGGKATGSTNIVSGLYAQSHGQGNTASGSFGSADGNYAYSRTVSQQTFASGKFATLGDAQTSVIAMHKITTDATTSTIGVSGSSTSHALLPNQSVAFSVMVVARDTTGTDTSAWKVEGMARRGATGSTVIVNPIVTVLGQDTGASTWTLAVTGDSNGGLNIRATGIVGKTIKWVQRMTLTEVLI